MSLAIAEALAKQLSEELEVKATAWLDFSTDRTMFRVTDYKTDKMHHYQQAIDNLTISKATDVTMFYRNVCVGLGYHVEALRIKQGRDPKTGNKVVTLKELDDIVKSDWAPPSGLQPPPPPNKKDVMQRKSLPKYGRY